MGLIFEGLFRVIGLPCFSFHFFLLRARVSFEAGFKKRGDVMDAEMFPVAEYVFDDGDFIRGDQIFLEEGIGFIGALGWFKVVGFFEEDWVDFLFFSEMGDFYGFCFLWLGVFEIFRGNHYIVPFLVFVAFDDVSIGNLFFFGFADAGVADGGEIFSVEHIKVESPSLF